MASLIQFALDTVSISDAIEKARIALEAGVDWLEIGHPLIKFEGVKAIKALREEFPESYIYVDFMILAGARRYIEVAHKLGADNVSVSGLIPLASVQEAINIGKSLGVSVTVDLFNVDNVVEKASLFENMGADYIAIHVGTDQHNQVNLDATLLELKQVVGKIKVPVTYATYNLEESTKAVESGAKVIVIGEPILSSPNLRDELKRFVIETKRFSTKS